MEIRKEHKALTTERAGLRKLLKDPELRRQALAEQIGDIKTRFGQKTELGARRTLIGSAPSAVVVPLEAMVEREPITVFLSQKGWIRSVRGHQTDTSDVKYKEGDREQLMLHAETTDKLLLFATNGRFFTLSADKLPRGRGYGEPVRLMADLGNDADIVTLVKHDPEGRLLVASEDGRGFVVKEADVVAQTKSGRQVLNLAGGIEAKICVPASGDMVAVLGDNRKLLCFPLDEVPEMTRGRGVILQRYKDGGLADVSVFTAESGLTWRLGDRMRTETDLTTWLGKRAQAGRMPPKGFPRSNRFT